jgi:anterior pharynx defective protein 1
MAEAALTFGCALLAFGPFLSLFSLVVYQKAQLVIVVTTAAFFFLLGAVGASFCWFCFDYIGLNGPLAAIIPGVFFQFIFRCIFVSIYHRVERVIQITIHKQHDNEMRGDSSADRRSGTDQSIPRQPRGRQNQDWAEAAKLRLQLNDASCGIAAGVGYGGMHAIMIYGTLLASQTTNNVGILYQDSCPSMPSLVVSGLFAFFFSILDVFWMLFTFFGMRRRLIYQRGVHPTREVRAIGGWLGNSRTGGNLALLFCLISHFIASLLTTSDHFKLGCAVSLPAVGTVVLLTAYLFWAGVGRIYMPLAQPFTLTNSMSRVDSEE